MTDLIDSVLLLSCQVSALVDSIFFEEVANFVPRRKEVIVTAWLLSPVVNLV
jgi:hypothetical protein